MGPALTLPLVVKPRHGKATSRVVHKTDQSQGVSHARNTRRIGRGRYHRERGQVALMHARGLTPHDTHDARTWYGARQPGRQNHYGQPINHRNPKVNPRMGYPYLKMPAKDPSNTGFSVDMPFFEKAGPTVGRIMRAVLRQPPLNHTAAGRRVMRKAAI